MKQYLITDPNLYGKTPTQLSSTLRSVYLNHSIDFATFRDKRGLNSIELAREFVKVSREAKVEKVLINTHIDWAVELKADGVHLPTAKLNEIPYAKQQGLYVIASAHSIEDALQAQKLGADSITFSPIFATPNKGEPKGLEQLKEIVDIIKITVFALGGVVTREHIEALLWASPYGFASIRYFIK